MAGFVLNIYIVMPILLYLTFLSCSLLFSMLFWLHSCVFYIYTYDNTVLCYVSQCLLL